MPDRMPCGPRRGAPRGCGPEGHKTRAPESAPARTGSWSRKRGRGAEWSPEPVSGHVLIEAVADVFAGHSLKRVPSRRDRAAVTCVPAKAVLGVAAQSTVVTSPRSAGAASTTKPNEAPTGGGRLREPRWVASRHPVLAQLEMSTIPQNLADPGPSQQPGVPGLVCEGTQGLRHGSWRGRRPPPTDIAEFEPARPRHARGSGQRSPQNPYRPMVTIPRLHDVRSRFATSSATRTGE
jgi:hypothetical protein